MFCFLASTDICTDGKKLDPVAFSDGPCTCLPEIFALGEVSPTEDSPVFPCSTKVLLSRSGKGDGGTMVAVGICKSVSGNDALLASALKGFGDLAVGVAMTEDEDDGVWATKPPNSDDAEGNLEGSYNRFVELGIRLLDRGAVGEVGDAVTGDSNDVAAFDPLDRRLDAGSMLLCSSKKFVVLDADDGGGVVSGKC